MEKPPEPANRNEEHFDPAQEQRLGELHELLDTASLVVRQRARIEEAILNAQAREDNQALRRLSPLPALIDNLVRDMAEGEAAREAAQADRKDLEKQTRALQAHTHLTSLLTEIRERWLGLVP